MPNISVIMPAFNSERYIEEAIVSVINQTYTDWELIIIDDGSTDNTSLIVRKYLLIDSRIKYFYQKNSKQGVAKNRGISESSGIYIAFLDSDDLWLENKLKVSLMEILNGEYSLLFTNSYILDDNSAELCSLKTMGVTEKIYHGSPGLLAFFDSNKIPNLTVLVNKKAILDTGGFTNRALGEDYEMWLALLKNGCAFKSIALPLSIYREHENSATANDRLTTFDVIDILKKNTAKNPELAKEVKAILKSKIKYWLISGESQNNKNFRTIIAGYSSLPQCILFYIASYLLPFKLLKNIFLRFT